MTQQTYVDLRGYIGTLDPRKVQVPHVINGENFIVDSDGIQSNFGYQIATYAQLAPSVQVRSFSIDNELYMFTDTAVQRYNKQGKYFYPAFVFSAPAVDQFPWSGVEVGGIHYFARKGYNLISYNSQTGIWQEYLPGEVQSMPENIYGVTSVAGRLLILAEGILAWSAIDEGIDLVTDVEKGIGAQSLSLVGGGEPLGVFRSADGCVTYTKTGIMKTETIDAQNPFRHYELIDEENQTLIPIDAFNIIQFDERTNLMLTKTGFYSSSGRFPQAWQPLFSEYLTRKVFNRIDISVPGIVKLAFDEVGQKLFLSVSENGVPFIYDKAYVLYTPKDDWGIFNRRHIALLDADVTKSADARLVFGYICECQYLRVFTQLANTEIQPDPALAIYFTDQIEYPARMQDDKQVFSSYIYMSSLDRGEFNADSGLYEQATKAPLPPDLQPLNAYVDVGLMRVMEQEYFDRYNEAINILLGMNVEQETFEEEDWNEIEGVEEDWNVDAGEEDWGAGVVDSTDYDAELIGTSDGVTVYENNQEELQLVETQGRTRIYAASTIGLFHMLRVRAFKLDQSFHLKYLQFTSKLGGRL